MLIRKDDLVVVITGDDKGPTPRKVLRTIPSRGKIVVEGVNRVYKHMRPSQKNPQGGRLSKEMPIDASNVLLYSPTAGRGVRIAVRYTADGRKERFCRVTGASLGVIGAAKTRAAGAKPVAATRKSKA